jgi:PhnB protein
MTSTAQTQPETNVTYMAPYIFFYGRCEEALEFYKKVLRGTYEIMRNADSPMSEKVPAEWRNKVMHSKFTAPGILFMASDGWEPKPIDSEAGNISITLNIPDRAEGERVFKELSEGGKVKMPLDDAFWGGRFAAFDDRFGNEWMLTTT